MKLSLPIAAFWLLAQIPGLPGGCVPPSNPTQPYDCDAPPAQAGLVKLPGAIKGRYIVVLKPPSVRSSGLSVPGFAQQFVGLRDVRVFERVLPGFSAVLDEATLLKLFQHADVQYVQEDGPKKVDPQPALEAAISWGIDRVDQRNLPLDGKYEPGADGAGVHISVNDTGAPDCASPEFAGRCGESHTAIGGSGRDSHGHGSHVAGTVLGKTFGIAKGATLHACQSLNAQGQGSDSQVIECIDWFTQLCVSNGWRCVSNMSLGGPAAPALDQAVCGSIKQGVVHAVAAGNDNLGACSYSPSRVKQAIGAGASDDRDNAASFSNDGPCVALYAPGVDILSVGGSMSGTSMASPHVAGGAALCMQRHADVPNSPDVIKNCIIDGATPGKIGDGKDTTDKLLYVRAGEEPQPSPSPSAPPTPDPTPTPSVPPTPIPPTPTPVPTPTPTVSPCPPCPSPGPTPVPTPVPTPTPTSCEGKTEKRRGIGIQNVVRAGRAVCQGTESCYQALADGKVKVGDAVVTDSTALVKVGEPVPNGCGTCTEVPTKWSVSGVSATLKPDGQCGQSIKLLGPGNLVISATGAPGTTVTKPEKGKWPIKP